MLGVVCGLWELGWGGECLLFVVSLLAGVLQYVGDLVFYLQRNQVVSCSVYVVPSSVKVV
jgi:hypothetical protein